MEDDAVRLLNMDLLPMHDHQALLQIHGKEGHGIRFVVEGYQMPVIREEGRILGILTADRQAEDLAQIAVVGIDAVYNNRIITRIGADQIFMVGGEVQGRGCGAFGMVIIQGGDGLNLLEIRIAIDFIIEIDIDDILQLMDYIEIMTVLGEFHMPGRGFQLRMKDRALFDLACLVVQTINIDMIHTKVSGAEILVVSGHLDALDMGAEVTFRNGTEALQEQLVADLADGTVFIQTQDCDLAVMVAADEEELILIIGRQVGTSHAVDGGAVQFLKIAALQNLVGLHAFICNGIQEFTVMGNGNIGRVGNLNLLLLFQIAIFHINIVDPDAVFVLS